MKRVVIIANEERWNHPYFEKTFSNFIHHSQIIRNWVKGQQKEIIDPGDFPYQWASAISKCGSAVLLQVNEIFIFFLPQQMGRKQVEVVKKLVMTPDCLQLGCVLIDEATKDDFEQQHYDSVQMPGGLKMAKDVMMEEIGKRKRLTR